ncbi:hypothetical protein B7463_g12329, partial [Scytalidium lignicola]
MEAENTKTNIPLSLMARKFLDERLPDAIAHHRQEHPRHLSFCGEFYFFYGSLMDPETLRRVLKLQELPRLFPSKILGYHCMLWGEYPALIDGMLNEPVYGMAFEVQSPEDVTRLENYETKKYENTGCIIQFEDGTKVAGRTFVWAGDQAELKEGRFDLKDWKMDNLERNMY